MLERLKARVEKEFGEKITTVKHCQILSESIRDKCGGTVSETTLRRQWNLLSKTSKPSIHTLNLLSQYVDYESWDDFLAKNSKVEASRDEVFQWHLGKQNAEKYSLGAVNYLFKRAGIAAEDVIKRYFVDDSIGALLDSNFKATALVGPGGYGKSLGMASWVFRHVKKRRFEDSIIFFINGSQVDGLYNSSVSIASWLSTQVFRTGENVFANNDYLANHPFILIVDALDEIGSTLTKSNTFFKKLVDFIGIYENVKVVVSARTSVWSRELVYEILGNESSYSRWMGLITNPLNGDATNLPPLNYKEIQDVLDNQINKKNRKKKIIVDHLNFALKETVSHPYMLKIFVSIYSEEMLLLQNYNDLIDEFVSREIVNSKWAAEKLDIINFILKSQDYGKRLQPVKKNDLKDKYPVHLRKNGNYFAAYEHLLAFGILSEETVENRFKNMVTQVDFSHSNLRDLLIIRYVVERNNGVDFNLFKIVDKEYCNSDLKVRIVNGLYALAYSENNFEALKDFYSLPPSITLDRDILRASILQFRSDRPIQSLLIKEYGKYSSAKENLTNNIFDFDGLNTSFNKMLETLLPLADTPNERIYCLAGLAISNAQLLKYDDFLGLSSDLCDIPVDETIGTYSLIIYGIWKIYYAYILQNKVLIASLFEELLRVEEFYVARYENKTLARVNFYLEIIPHLILFKDSKRAKRLLQSLSDISLPKVVDDPKTLMAIDLYKKLCNEENGVLKELTPFESFTLERQINSLSLNQSYINRICANVLLAYSCLRMNDQEKFMYYYRNALEISGNCKYKLAEVALLKYLAKILAEVNLHKEAQSFRDYSVTLVERHFENFYDLV